MARFFAYLWAAPTTFLGLLFLTPLPFALRFGRVRGRVVDGVIELHGGVISLFLRRGTLLSGGAAAMTLGHVVLGYDLQSLNRTRAHERVHVKQAERWGPAFIPAYLCASLIAWRRGRDPYMGNPFEIEAYAAAP